MIEMYRIIFTGRGTFIHCIIWFQYAHMVNGWKTQTEAGGGNRVAISSSNNQPDGNHTSNAIAHESECRPEK